MIVFLDATFMLSKFTKREQQQLVSLAVRVAPEGRVTIS